jgi:glycosyltransferase involved in cell wall biosynthesis
MHVKRITFVADELLGYHRCGGLGTTTTLNALALARAGHQVEMLYTGGEEGAPDAEWRDHYEAAGVTVRRLETADANVAPAFLAKARAVARYLAEHEPDVVVTQDLGAPCYLALRLRQLGLAFDDTAFVVRCSGTRRWVAYASRKVRVLPGALAISLLERASFELADVVVSENHYMLEWMRDQGWRLPEQEVVIPNLIQSHELGVGEDAAALARSREATRLAFFGRLEERKGIRILLEALESLEPELLRGLELVFVGVETHTWTPARILSEMSDRLRGTFDRITFETTLGRSEALRLLAKPGTLVVMPSLEDNSPNTVVECVCLGLPFLASRAGGTSELIAPADRERVLFEPTADGLAEALERVLRSGSLPSPAAPAYQPKDALAAWDEVVRMEPRARPRRPWNEPAVDVVVTHRRSWQALERCLQALARQEGVQGRVVVAVAGRRLPDPDGLPGRPVLVRSQRSTVEAARQAGLEACEAPFVCFLDEEDVPDPELLSTLARAQAASAADVVSCALRLRDESGERLHFFLGEPGGLGVLENAYGTVALLRRSLLRDLSTPWPSEHDPDWPLLAKLHLEGARIVSVPRALVTSSRRPGTVGTSPGDALLVLERCERALPEQLDSAARVAAGLAAQAAREADSKRDADGTSPRPRRRLAALARRARRAL